MKKARAIFVVVFISICVGAIFYWMHLSEPEKWLLVDGTVAEKHAKELITNNNIAKTPDALLDYVIISRRGLVIFSKHDSDDILVYSPQGVPVSEDLKDVIWRKARNGWYFGKQSPSRN